MRGRGLLEVLMMALLAAGPFAVRPARAQSADPKSAAPESARPVDAGASVATSGSELQTTAPPRGGQVDEERDPGRGPGMHQPVFLEPLATSAEHAQLGLSSWIAPGAPFEHRENPGGAAIGFSIAWPAPRKDLPSSGPSAWRGSAAR